MLLFVKRFYCLFRRSFFSLVQPGIQFLHDILPAKLFNEKYKLLIPIGYYAQYFGCMFGVAQTEIVFILSAGLFRFVDQTLKLHDCSLLFNNNVFTVRSSLSVR